MELKSKQWWGAPKKFSLEQEERKISWLELFYDLVYVIAIAKITNLFSMNLNFTGFLDYLFFFTIIFWGWLNGSLYHDMHGSAGFRTRIMTLWQMLIVAALVIVLGGHSEQRIHNISLVLIVMQTYITYMWFSVGFYDKNHRKLNLPYTLLYLLALALMVLTLFLENPWLKIVFFAALVFNYLPPFITYRRFRNESLQLNLSSSMTERLGLFAIIIFGEVIAGVISGMAENNDLSFSLWVNFALSVIIVFSLWWVFFTLVSDRPCKPGFLNSSLLELLYLPALISLGLAGLGLHGIFSDPAHSEAHFVGLREIFALAISLFFLIMILILFLLEFPKIYAALIRKTQIIFFGGILAAVSLGIFNKGLSTFWFLCTGLGLILTIIVLLNYNWYSLQSALSGRNDDV